MRISVEHRTGFGMYTNSYICENFTCLPQLVRLRGICPSREFFTMDFLSSDRERLLHIKVFPGERRMVINSFVKNGWGEEAPFGDLDMTVGAPVSFVEAGGSMRRSFVPGAGRRRQEKSRSRRRTRSTRKLLDHSSVKRTRRPQWSIAL